MHHLIAHMLIVIHNGMDNLQPSCEAVIILITILSLPGFSRYESPVPMSTGAGRD